MPRHARRGRRASRRQSQSWWGKFPPQELSLRTPGKMDPGAGGWARWTMTSPVRISLDSATHSPRWDKIPRGGNVIRHHEGAHLTVRQNPDRDGHRLLAEGQRIEPIVCRGQGTEVVHSEIPYAGPIVILTPVSPPRMRMAPSRHRARWRQVPGRHGRDRLKRAFCQDAVGRVQYQGIPPRRGRTDWADIDTPGWLCRLRP